MKQNVALFDSTKEEAKDFIEGLKKTTEKEWTALVYNSNRGRTGLINVMRYIKYFIFPFKIFLKRKNMMLSLGGRNFTDLYMHSIADCFM